MNLDPSNDFAAHILPGRRIGCWAVNDGKDCEEGEESVHWFECRNIGAWPEVEVTIV